MRKKNERFCFINYPKNTGASLRIFLVAIVIDVDICLTDEPLQQKAVGIVPLNAPETAHLETVLQPQEVTRLQRVKVRVATVLPDRFVRRDPRKVSFLALVRSPDPPHAERNQQLLDGRLEQLRVLLRRNGGQPLAKALAPTPRVVERHVTLVVHDVTLLRCGVNFKQTPN